MHASKHAAAVILLLLVSLFGVGCQDDVERGVTEIVVRVDADDALKRRATTLQVIARGATKNVALSGKNLLPLPFSLVPPNGSTGGTVTIRLRDAAEILAERTVELRFQEGRRLLWDVWLDEACIPGACSESARSCGPCGKCVARLVGADELVLWSANEQLPEPPSAPRCLGVTDGNFPSLDGGDGQIAEEGGLSEAGATSEAGMMEGGSSAAISLRAATLVASNECEALMVEAPAGGDLTLMGTGLLTFHMDAKCTTSAVTRLSAPASGAQTVYFKVNLAPSVLARDVTLSAMSDTGAVSNELVVHVRLRMREVAVGAEHACAIADDEQLYCWGSSRFGQAGVNALSTDYVGVPKQVTRPRALTASSKTESITAGGMHSCAILDGAAYCFGGNEYGQLGTGGTTGSALPVLVSSLDSNVTGIDAGSTNTCAVQSGAAKCWGDNRSKQVSQASDTYISTPTLIPSLGAGVSDVCAGGDFACAVKDGGVSCWGDNFYGQLGRGNFDPATSPAFVSGLGAGTQVEDVSCGLQYACARLLTGEVRCWGRNAEYPVFSASGANSATPVSVAGLAGEKLVDAGGAHTCVSDGASVRCFGNNATAQAGVGKVAPGGVTPDRVAPPGTSVGANGPVTAVSAGLEANYSATSCMIQRGLVYCWGGNVTGSLGSSPDLRSSYLPRRVQADSGLSFSAVALGSSYPGGHVCAIAAGEVYCWGFSLFGRLGNNTQSIPESTLTATKVQGVSGAKALVSGGEANTCAIALNAQGKSRVYCWGGNLLQDGWSPTPYQVDVSSEPNHEVEHICLGRGHACAVVSGDPNGSLYCWGQDVDGALGDSNSTHGLAVVAPTVIVGSGATAGTATHVDCAYEGTCAVIDGKVSCWGRLGGVSISQTPTAAAVAGLTSGVTVERVQVSGGKFCALKSNGEIACSLEPFTSSQSVSGTGYTAIEAGAGVTCAKNAAGLSCWGENQFGQIGNGVASQTVVGPTAVMGLAPSVGAFATGAGEAAVTCAVTGSGELYCWGSNAHRALGGDAPWISTSPRACADPVLP